MKFKSNIESQAGIEDSAGSAGTDGKILSSLGVDGNGVAGVEWIDQGDVVAGEADKAKSVILRVKNSTLSAMTKGQVICENVSISPPSGNLIEVALADNNATGKMPALGILNEDLDASGGNNDEGDAIMFGKVSGIDTSAFQVGDEVFVSDAPGGLTTTKPTGVKYIQKVGVVIRDDNTNGTIEVFGAGRVNDVPTPLYVDHANQRLGIGTTTPTSRLHSVTTNSGPVDYTNRAAVLGINDSTDTLYANSVGVAGKVSTSGGFAIYGDASGAGGWAGYFDGKGYFLGNVGIGTTSPDSKLEVASTDSNTYLHVRNDSTGSTRLKMSNNTDTNANGFQIINNSSNMGGQVNLLNYKASTLAIWTNNSQRMTILSGGNVGIGTTSPSEKLTVRNGTSNTDVKILAYNSAAGTEATLKFSTIASETNYEKAAIIARNAAGSFGRSDMHFALDSTADSGNVQFSDTKMTILNGGNVGIGTTSPQAKLHVANGTLRTWSPTFGTSAIFESTASNRNFLTLTAANEAELWFGNASTQTLGRIRYEMAGNNMEFWTNATQKMVINSSGNVGIGTTSLTSISSTSTTLSLGSTSTTTSGGIAFQANGVVKAYNYVTNNYLINQTVSGIGQIFYGAGSERIRIHNTTGNVGVNTTDPKAKLHVASGAGSDTPVAGTTNGGLFVSNTNKSYGINMGVSGSGWGWIQSQRADTNTTLYNLNLQPLGGNVGIGTTLPNAKTHIFNGTAQNGLIVENSSSSFTDSAIFANNTSTTNGYLLRLRSSGSDKMVVSGQGNVGIGTTSPSELLHLKSTGPARILIEADSDNVTETDNPQIILKQDGGAVVSRLGYRTNTNDLEFVNEYTSNLYLGTSNSIRATLHANGNFGIGTTGPRTKLHVSGLTGDDDPSLGSSTAPLFVSNTANSYGLNIGVNNVGASWLQAQSNTSATAYNMLLNPLGGNVGIGMTSPSSKLYIQGSTSNSSSQLMRIRSTSSSTSTPLRIIEFIRSNYAVRGYISMNQYGVQYNTSSDYRLKENITPINNALDRLNKLKPNRFSWKEGPSDYKVDGFIAHEVAEVIPEAVSGEKDAVDENNKPSYQGIDQAKIVPLLTAALQEAISKIEQLETRIQTLENK